jgi:hypothetical protein
MGDKELQRLRDQQAIVKLPDGREGVSVMLQYRGDTPALDRAGRKKWLQQQFDRVGATLGQSQILLKLETVSPSAQTVEAVCPVEQFSKAQDLAKASGLRIDVMSKVQMF